MAGPVSVAVGNSAVLPESSRWIAAVTLALSNFIVILDMTVANVSVPHIAGSLGVSLDQGSWVITSYAVAEAISVPLTGWLVLRFGAPRLYFLCLSGFGLFSLLCGMSVTLQMIVACRIGQGFFGGLIMPLSQTLMMMVFPPEQRTKALVLTSMTTLMAPALGPNLGGYISDTLSWHWIFLINIPIVIVSIMANSVLLRGIVSETRKVPIDTVGLVLMVVWIAALQFILDLGRNRDWFGDPMIVIMAVVAVIAFIAFVIWELTDEHPIVDIRIFRHSGFTFAVVALTLAMSSYFATIVLIPQWLQTGLGFPAAAAGFVVSCTAFGALLTGRVAASMVHRFDPRLMISLAIGWMGCMALVRAGWNNDIDYWRLPIPQLVQGLGLSFFMVPLMSMTVMSVPQEEIASATGIQTFLRSLGTAAGAALALTAWGNAQQEARSEIAANLQPADAMDALARAGMSSDQALRMIERIVDKEAMMLATNQIFIYTSVVIFIGAAVIWLAPRIYLPQPTSKK